MAQYGRHYLHPDGERACLSGGHHGLPALRSGHAGCDLLLWRSEKWVHWHSRAVLAWEISNTMDSAFCVRALKEALRRTGRKPNIFNTDQGSQFTGNDWISELQKQSIQISMDGRGRWMDNVFIERLWRSLKYEKLRLWSYQTIPELRALTADWIEFYNHRRKHQAHGYNTPWSVYQTPVSQAA